MSAVAALPDRWRAKAQDFAAFGANAQATTCTLLADELEAALQVQDVATVTLAEASRIGGYSTEHLARLVRSGQLPNAGRKGAPRLHRRDVPTRAAYQPPPSLRLVESGNSVASVRADLARGVISSHRR